MIEIEKFRLVGISLNGKTTNDNGKSAIDCGNLWNQFISGNYADSIPGKISNDLFAVYHNYESDYTGPFSYFIGCKVNSEVIVPDGMDGLFIPEGNYKMFTAKGMMPECIASAWKEIWKSEITRAYRPDFEVYSEKSKDWNNSEIDIFISVK